jgi:hypothetical protein
MMATGRWLALASLVVLMMVSTGCSNPEAAKCMADFNNRIGHPLNDDLFWQHLQDCARKKLLPSGQNDPGYYE